MKKLDSFYVIPAYTFFYWGFTFPKKFNDDFIDFFGFKEGHLLNEIFISINGKKYPAKIRMARINNKGKFEGRSEKKWRERNVIQCFYDREYDTLKALRKLFIYSYASTIRKDKPKLKEVLEFIHVKDNIFRIKVISQQETDFDDMFKFMEDKNLFKYWQMKNSKKAKKEQIILNYSKKWISANDIDNYKDRNNVIYLLYHSANRQLYIGKANNLGSRVKKNKGRIGLKADWDKFMWFEVNPSQNMFLEELEHFLIRTFASILDNQLDVETVIKSKIELVNKQLKKNKI
jgi:hypothetical protein